MKKQQQVDPRRWERPHSLKCECTWCGKERADLRKRGHWAGDPLPKQLSFADTVSNDEWIKVAFAPDYRH
jgi:hypothetical protein